MSLHRWTKLFYLAKQKFCDCIRSFREQQWAVWGLVCLSVSIAPYLLYICLSLLYSISSWIKVCVGGCVVLLPAVTLQHLQYFVHIQHVMKWTRAQWGSDHAHESILLFVTEFTGVHWAASEGTGSQPVCGGLSTERDKDLVVKIWVWAWNWQLNTKVKENAASLRRLKNYLPNRANYCWQLLNRNSAVVTFYQLTFRFSSSHPARRWFFSRHAFTLTQTSSLNHRGLSAIQHLNNPSPQKRNLPGQTL